MDVLQGLSNREEPLTAVVRLLGEVHEDRTPPPAVRRQIQHRLDGVEADQLVQAYQTGAGVKQLAAIFGVSRQTVSQHLNRAGVERRRPGLDEQQISEAVGLYAQGWSLKRLGDRFGVNAETVRKELRKRGIELRPRSGWERNS